jgi:acetyl esterase/lipase
MRLWSDDIDALRDDARQVVAAGFAAMAEAFGESGPPPSDPAERTRRQRAQFARNFDPVPEAEVRAIAGVPCRVFRPPAPPRAVYLHFHGGGMILGAPEMNDQGNRELSRSLGVTVVSVDYRLAPEHPFPAGPDDGVAVAAWLLEHAGDELGSPRLLLGGESAGGYMAAAVLLRIRDDLDAAGRVDGANLVFGVYDWGRSPSQRGVRAHTGPDMLTPEGIAFFADCYLPGRTDDERRAPDVSPAFADLRGLAPALLSVGTNDHLLDDTVWLASRWAAAGNDTELVVLPEMPHGFMAFPCAMTKAWARRTHDWFTEILARPPRAAGT